MFLLLQLFRRGTFLNFSTFRIIFRYFPNPINSFYFFFHQIIPSSLLVKFNNRSYLILLKKYEILKLINFMWFMCNIKILMCMCHTNQNFKLSELISLLFVFPTINVSRIPNLSCLLSKSSWQQNYFTSMISMTHGFHPPQKKSPSTFIDFLDFFHPPLHVYCMYVLVFSKKSHPPRLFQPPRLVIWQLLHPLHVYSNLHVY